MLELLLCSMHSKSGLPSAEALAHRLRRHFRAQVFNPPPLFTSRSP
jgi:hypothetical protein